MKTAETTAATTYCWYTVKTRRPPRVTHRAGGHFPQWVTGSREIAEAHLLNRIAEEGNASLKLYGIRWNENTWTHCG